MKQFFSIIVASLLLSVSTISNAQNNNVINKYGPPTYTGGTYASPSESFAGYHQTLANMRMVQPATGFILNVYPNPAQSSTRIVLNERTTGPTTISFVNMNGVIVASREFTVGAAEFDLDVSNLPTGIYSLQVQERGKESQSIQLVKNP